MPREGNVHTLENKVSWEPHVRIAQCPVTRKKSIREGSVQLQRRERAPSPTRKKSSFEVWHQNPSIPIAIWTCKTKPSSEKTQVALGRGATLMDGKPGTGEEKPAGAGARGERG